MANEILYSGLGDQRLSEVLNTEALMLLADRNSLGNHPALFKADTVRARGSLVVKVPALGIAGYDLMSTSGSESANEANAALVDASYTVTVARRSLAREWSGTAKLTDPGLITRDTFVMDAFGAYNAALTNALAALPQNFSNYVGTSGVNAAVSDILAAKAYLLGANADDGQVPLLTLLHSQQWSDVLAELAQTSGGAVQFMQATQDLVNRRGGGFQGTFLSCDIFLSNRVPGINTNADRGGGMFTRGAVIWADMDVEVEDPTQQISLGGKVLFERSRNARQDLTAYVSHSYFGVAEGIDARGVGIFTDY